VVSLTDKAETEVLRLLRLLFKVFVGIVLLAYATPSEAASFNVREQQILDLIVQEVTQRSQVSREDVVVEWQDNRLNSMVSAVPEGAVTLSIVSTARLNGRGNVPIQILVDGKKFRTIFPKVSIQVYQQVLVAKAPIPRGATPTTADVALERKAIDPNVYTQPMRSLEGLAGAQAVRNLAAGTVLTAQLFKIPPVVKQGSIVTVTLLSGEMTLITSGKARSNGSVGQIIKVLNMDSKREFSARVTGPDKVEVKLED
jgi:flagella basal body P-ring formation protein FlgA